MSRPPFSQLIASRWMVVTGHPLATRAGAQILEAGGNAVDAGVAAAICLGVVHPDFVSAAGVAPAMVHLARTGETWTVSGVGGWPRQASMEFFHRRCGGQIPPGILRTVVPGAPRAWCRLLANWGTLSFGEVSAAAIDYARHGFPLSEFSAMQVRTNRDSFRRWPTSAALFLRDGRAPRAGERFVQAELAGTLEAMTMAEARAGGRRQAILAAADAFYKGEVAAAICAYHAREGGLLTASDLADFEVEVGAPCRTTFHDVEVAISGFWSQGPALLQTLNILEGAGLGEFGHNTVDYLHRLAEATKLAFADREAFYGDPAQVEVPADALLAKDYAAIRRRLIGERAWPDMPPPGDPEGTPARRAVAGSVLRSDAAPSVVDTSYVAVVDAAGNAFSCTPSDPALDSPVVPGVGCVVSPRGAQSWLDPGHPSAVAPGRRPRLSPAPAMAFKDGKLLMAFGSPGADVQLQAMLQFFLNVVVFGMPPQEAVEAPRVASRSFPDSYWPHPSFPGQLCVEEGMPPEIGEGLRARGHVVQHWAERDWRAGGVCSIVTGPAQTLWAAADSRRTSHAIGS